MTTVGQPAPNKSGDGLAVASLVLGILACLSFWVFPLCAAFAVVALVLGRVSQKRLGVDPSARRGARGWATAGIVLALSGFLLSVVLLVSCVFVANRVASEGQKEFGRAIQELESDPEIKKQLDDLRQELDKLEDTTPAGGDSPKAGDKPAPDEKSPE